MKIEEDKSLTNALSPLPWVAGFKAVKCGHADCRRWLTRRHLVTRKVGVTVLDRWYCSYACFAPTAVQRFLRLIASPSVPSTRTSRMPLPLILIHRNCLTVEQSRIAAASQETTGTEIGDVLVQLGYCSEEDVLTARSIQWGCPVFSASAHLHLPPIHIPVTLLRTHSMVPLHYVPATNTLLMGFSSGIEYAVLYAIEQMTGCNTKACLITPSDLQRHMQLRASQPAPDDLTFESFSNPSQMTRVLCDYGALLNAHEISIGRCREYVWVRMKVPSGSSDVLFRVA